MVRHKVFGRQQKRKYHGGPSLAAHHGRTDPSPHIPPPQDDDEEHVGSQLLTEKLHLMRDLQRLREAEADLRAAAFLRSFNRGAEASYSQPAEDCDEDCASDTAHVLVTTAIASVSGCATYKECMCVCRRIGHRSEESEEPLAFEDAGMSTSTARGWKLANRW